VLAHDDAQSKEGSGSSVAVATGWQAAGHILSSARWWFRPISRAFTPNGRRT